MFINCLHKISPRRSLCVASVITASLLQSACYVSPVNGGLEYKFGIAPSGPTQTRPKGPQPFTALDADYQNKQFARFTIYAAKAYRLPKAKPIFTLERIGEVAGHPVTDLKQFDQIYTNGSISQRPGYLRFGFLYPDGKQSLAYRPDAIRLVYLMENSFPENTSFVEYHYAPPPQGRYRLTLETKEEYSYRFDSRSRYHKDVVNEIAYRGDKQSIEFDLMAGEIKFVRLDFTEDEAKHIMHWTLVQPTYEEAKQELASIYTLP
ncbi:MAG: hypothetical protein ACRCV6_07155 [Formosimonas sp.]